MAAMLIVPKGPVGLTLTTSAINEIVALMNQDQDK
jgi:hypothetical protein